jgi:multiple sugar transport system permease protein
LGQGWRKARPLLARHNLQGSPLTAPAAVPESNRGGIEHRPPGRLRRSVPAYLFIAPYFLFFSAFLVVPFGWAVYLSFQRGGLLQAPVFVGTEDYFNLFHDPLAWQSFLNTLHFVVVTVPAAVIIGLGLALLINNRLVKGQTFFKMVVFFPLLASLAAVAQIWSYLFMPFYGLIDYLLGLVGLPQLPWLTDTTWALYGIVIVQIWAGIGFHVLLYIAALRNIPPELLEAASLDGANGPRRFYFVTLPLLRPVLLFLIVMSTIWTFQLFDTVFVLTDGGPVNSTTTMVWYLYNNAFRYNNVGVACAMGVMLVLVLAPISYVQSRFLRADIEY